MNFILVIGTVASQVLILPLHSQAMLAGTLAPYAPPLDAKPNKQKME